MGSPSTARAETAPIGVLGRMRIARRLSVLLGLLALFLSLHYLWRLTGRRSPWPSRFLGAAGRACGARWRRSGEPVRRHIFLVSNHLSWLDIFVLGGASGTAFVAKAELATHPVVRWLVDLNRTIYVARDDRLGVGHQVARVRDALAEGHPVAIFPEGTTGDGNGLLPFKSAMLKVIDPPPPGVQVQPVLLHYGEATRSVAWGDEPGLSNIFRILAGRSFPVTAHFLDPFDPAAFGGRKAIASECRVRIEAAHRTLSTGGGNAGGGREGPA